MCDILNRRWIGYKKTFLSLYNCNPKKPLENGNSPMARKVFLLRNITK